MYTGTVLVPAIVLRVAWGFLYCHYAFVILDFEPSTLDPRLLATLLKWYYPIDPSIQIFQLINVFPAYVKTIAT